MEKTREMEGRERGGGNGGSRGKGKEKEEDEKGILAITVCTVVQN